MAVHVYELARFLQGITLLGFAPRQPNPKHFENDPSPAGITAIQ
jgi:hypothetical protein